VDGALEPLPGARGRLVPRRQESHRPALGRPGGKRAERRLAELLEEIDDLSRVLYADDRVAVLCIFQAMDAAGKDGTIRDVFTAVDPASLEVHYFKQPSSEELDHDFLWRTTRHLPPRGRIGVFNRSYYEEALVVRVHPELLEHQKLPWRTKGARLWKERFDSIRDHERHLARNGTALLKFWLNVSRDEQRRRFRSRLDSPHKNWKFSEQDVRESELWDEYMNAFEEALNATSRPWAPWYAIPADDKSYAHLCVAEIVVETLRSLDLRYPELEEKQLEKFEAIRHLLTEPRRKRS
jgi:PPK2 family polyphosphate:nucleotide phosphotransferase